MSGSVGGFFFGGTSVRVSKRMLLAQLLSKNKLVTINVEQIKKCYYIDDKIAILVRVPAHIVPARKASEEVFPEGIFPFVAELGALPAGEGIGPLHRPESQGVIAVTARGSVVGNGKSCLLYTSPSPRD